MPTRTEVDLERAARLFHALSDETRLSILQRLRLGERCVCDLTDALDAAQSRLSFHLKVLKDAGLVTDRRDGRWMYYTLNTETLGEVAELSRRLPRLRPPRSGRMAAADRFFFRLHQQILIRSPMSTEDMKATVRERYGQAARE